MSLPRVGQRYEVRYSGDNGSDFITIIEVGDLSGMRFDEVEFRWDDDGSYEVMDADEFNEWPLLKKVTP